MALRVAVVGAGRMGKLHARVLSEMPEAELAGVADTNLAAAEAVGAQRDCYFTADAGELVDRCDAAVISAPTTTHTALARPFVQAGKSVLIEKPISEDLDDARALIDLARSTGAVVQVGHAERFNPAVMAMRKHAIQPKFIESHRISPYPFRSTDIGVVLDLMIHDIDIVLMLAGTNEVVSLDAVGVNVMGESEDIANARIHFAGGCVANITASRLAIKTERKIRVFSESAYLSVDYQARTGIVVRKEANLDLVQMARKMGVRDMSQLTAPADYKKLVNVEQLEVDDSSEPLRRQAEAFVRAVTQGEKPEVSAEDGLAAVTIAHRITEAVRQHPWDGEPGGRVGLGVLGE